jgi:hypothetical protein
MRIRKISAMVILGFFLLAPAAMAQNQTAAASSANQLVPIKVQVVFREYQGSKEISVLPYTIPAVATAGHHQDRSSLRVGLKVPIAVGGVETTTNTRMWERTSTAGERSWGAGSTGLV